MEDICASMKSFNDIANDDGNRIQMNEQLADFIETHSSLLELSARWSGLHLIFTEFQNSAFILHVFPDYSVNFLA